MGAGAQLEAGRQVLEDVGHGPLGGGRSHRDRSGVESFGDQPDSETGRMASISRGVIPIGVCSAASGVRGILSAPHSGDHGAHQVGGDVGLALVGRAHGPQQPRRRGSPPPHDRGDTAADDAEHVGLPHPVHHQGHAHLGVHEGAQVPERGLVHGGGDKQGDLSTPPTTRPPARHPPCAPTVTR